MQKFGLIFLAVSSALLGLVVPVDGVALVDRETNADRFARGLPPLPPRAPNHEVERRANPLRRDPTPTFEERGFSPLKRAPAPSKRAPAPSKRAPAPSKRAPAPSKRAPAPSKRAPAPSKRAPAPSKRAPAPSKRAPAPSKRAPAPSKRAPVPSKRAPAPSKRAPAPSKRADTPTFEKRTQPSKRADTPTFEKRTQPSAHPKRAEPEAEVFHAPYWQLTSGRLEVRWACNDSIAGYVANNPTGGSFGLNDGKLLGEDDLYVEYFDSNLMVMNPEFPPPYFVGGGDAASSVHDCSNKIRFGAVELGSSSAVWILDPMSGALNATLINENGSEDKPSLVFDSAHNVLSFTHDVNRNPTTELPVYIYLSD